MNYTQVKNTLYSCIDEMKQQVHQYCEQPDKDFTRNRKLDFSTMMKFIIFMEGGPMQTELLEYFDYDKDTATSSAFIQQRYKLSHNAFPTLFSKFNQTYERKNTFDGYHLLAIDGSAISYMKNPKEEMTHIQNKQDNKGYNQIMLNASYDLLEHQYVDCVLQPIHEKNEVDAAIEMIKHSNIHTNTIFIEDRGYESYNLFAHIGEAGYKYLVRVKDIDSNGILSALDLPNTAFDIQTTRVLTRKQTNKVKQRPEKYRFIPVKQRFDFFDENREYNISFRMVRFLISEGIYETVITNLSEEEMSTEKIKELYHMRWRIETSFRELKYTIGLLNLHSNQQKIVEQEIYARMILFNMCRVLSKDIVMKQEKKKYQYQLNMNRFIRYIKRFLKRKSGDESPPDINHLISMFITPVRPGRSYDRKMGSKKHIMDHQYRIS